MDEHLARVVADELVKVTEPPAGAYNSRWGVTFGVGANTYCLFYDRKEMADSVAQALRMLAITAIKRYNGASPRSTLGDSPVTEPDKKELPPILLEGPMPDLFAGELEAMSKILGRVSEMLGKEAHRLADLRQAATNLATASAGVAAYLPKGSNRDYLLLKVNAVTEILSTFEKG